MRTFSEIHNWPPMTRLRESRSLSRYIHRSRFPSMDRPLEPLMRLYLFAQEALAARGLC